MTKHMGRVIWRETMTKDVAKAKAFYGALFGWSFKDMDMGPGGTYPIIENAGVGIGGMMALSPEMAGVPSHWTSYVAVKDVDAAFATASANGGGKTWGPMDVPNVGRMGGVRGFDGAALSIMKPEGPDQERPARLPVGAFCWETLVTADMDRAKTFWSAVCDWQTYAGGGMPTFGVAPGMENQVADIRLAQGPVPPNWLTYVVVEKIEPSCDKAAALGGKVMMPAMAVPGIGRIAVVLDDQGAALGLFEPAAS